MEEIRYQDSIGSPSLFSDTAFGEAPQLESIFASACGWLAFELGRVGGSCLEEDPIKTRKATQQNGWCDEVRWNCSALRVDGVSPRSLFG